MASYPYFPTYSLSSLPGENCGGKWPLLLSKRVPAKPNTQHTPAQAQRMHSLNQQYSPENPMHACVCGLFVTSALLMVVQMTPVTTGTGYLV